MCPSKVSRGHLYLSDSYFLKVPPQLVPRFWLGLCAGCVNRSLCCVPKSAMQSCRVIVGGTVIRCGFVNNLGDDREV